ncbi:MAG: Mov34/MPN/PAD-1 family protein [Bacteroidota bacterium]
MKLTDQCLSLMNSYKQDDPSKYESGGVLIGRLIISSKDIVVDKVTTPLPEDVQSLNSFIRSTAHQNIIEKEWSESNGTSLYLGEWHTHPESSPTPSSKDIKSWKEQLKTATFSSRFLYFVIIGIEEYGVWEGDRRTLKIRRIDNNGG